MSNANRKAKGTTMADTKLRKAEKRLAEVGQQLQATNISLMNMRQMYEGAITEKNALKNRMVRAEMLVTAFAAQARGGQARLKAKTLEGLNDYAGFDLTDDDGDLLVTPISLDDVEAMEAETDLAEAEDDE
jgi:hypothetical protein